MMWVYNARTNQVGTLQYQETVDEDERPVSYTYVNVNGNEDTIDFWLSADCILLPHNHRPTVHVLGIGRVH